MVGWGRGHKNCRIIIFLEPLSRTPKKKPPKIQNAPKFEKDLNENIISRKRENHTETLGGGMW
jgi:hypothetical protein